MESAALPFLVTCVLWFDLVSCVSTGTSPRLPYKKLLAMEVIDLETVMGCANWAMLAIGDLASLNAWKKNAFSQPFRSSGGISSNRTFKGRSELVARSREIEKRLEDGLSTLASQELRMASASTLPGSVHHQHDQLPPPPTRPSPGPAITKTVTRVFATAALVQLHSITLDSRPSAPRIRSAVERTCSALRQIRNPQDLRGLIWPLCIAGCMSADPSRQQEFEALIGSALARNDDADADAEPHPDPESRGSAEQKTDFGNSATVLKIMRKCWEGRRRQARAATTTHEDEDWDGGGDDQEWNWERAMKELDMYALLV